MVDNFYILQSYVNLYQSAGMEKGMYEEIIIESIILQTKPYK